MPLAQLSWLQAQPPVLAMTMVQLQLTARLCQQPRHQLDVFCWQGLLGRAALREVLHMLSQLSHRGASGTLPEETSGGVPDVRDSKCGHLPIPYTHCIPGWSYIQLAPEQTSPQGLGQAPVLCWQKTGHG